MIRMNLTTRLLLFLQMVMLIAIETTIDFIVFNFYRIPSLVDEELVPIAKAGPSKEPTRRVQKANYRKKKGIMAFN